MSADGLALADVDVRAARYHRAAGHPRLDWRPHHDPRSRLYAAADVVDTSQWIERIWPTPLAPLDQGRDGACIGAACAQVVNTAGPGAGAADPPLTMGEAANWYRIAQVLDQYPGNSYVGTSVLGGMAVGVDRGYWTGYRWAFSVPELAAAVTTLGPGVIGVPWYAGMSKLGAREPLTISGPKIGGHALAVVGAVHHRVFGDCLVVLCSYGPQWGDGGFAHLPFATAAALLADHGEAAVPTGRPVTPPRWQWL